MLDTMNRSRNSLSRSHDSLSRSHDSLSRSRDSLTRSRNSMARSRDSLTRSRYSLSRSRDSMTRSRDSLSRSRDSMSSWSCSMTAISDSMNAVLDSLGRASRFEAEIFAIESHASRIETAARRSLSGNFDLECGRTGKVSWKHRFLAASCRNESRERGLETGDDSNMSGDRAIDARYRRSMSSLPISLARESASLCRNLFSM